MYPSLHKLSKFIELETRRKYDNKAVVGGLANILQTWTLEAEREGVPADLIQIVTRNLQDYKNATFDKRAEIISVLDNEIRNYPLSGNEKAKIVQDVSSRPASKDKLTAEKPNSNGNTLYDNALHAPITNISGVGASSAKKLEKLGIHTIRDMLFFFPRRYDDFSELKPINRLEYGEEVTVIGTIKSISSRPTKNPKLRITEAVLTDGTGFIRLIWFNRRFLEKSIRPNMQIVVSGKIDRYLGRLMLNNPDWERLDKQQLHTNRIVPVYSLTADIHQRTLRNTIHKTVSFWSSKITDHLPETIKQDARLVDLQYAISQIHFPDTKENLKKAQQRLAFDEILFLQLGVLQQKKEWQARTAEVFQIHEGWLEGKLANLPFKLTDAQDNSLGEIRKDLASGYPMNRLLQGDVGSGKTVVAALAAAMVCEHSGQTAVLAPTSILAEQHYKSFRNHFGQFDPANNADADHGIRLLLGDSSQREKAEIKTGLENGSIKILVGTHAILEDPVTFKNLQLAIIDEQHRFGVDQRAKLRQKGNNPHLLVMTATPIPRSLALTIYGDLDLTIIDEMPKGRIPVETHVFSPLERERAYSLIQSQIESGNQAFIVYPLVEEGENEDAKAAVSEHKRLQEEIFPRLRIGLLHGRLKQEEKESVMNAFRDRRYDILVSTSVIEVGVDIPNATIMLIEGANRFGLAQLHQFRGRVGRGEEKSYCVLIPETEHNIENQRLKVMTETTDGFKLAENDLSLRGPGEFLGKRQSGYTTLKMANITDIKLIEKARKYALQLFETDPDLEHLDNMKLKQAVEHLWKVNLGDIS